MPEQTEVAEDAMVTLTAWLALTVMVSALEVAGLPVAQGVILEVSTHLITSLFEKSTPAERLKVEFVAPDILLPFLVHW